MNVAIIGGGASGMFCAANLKLGGCNTVTVFEKCDLTLKKLLITGNGRCNVTNLKSPTKFLENVPTNPDFLRDCIVQFDSKNMQEFLHNFDLDTITESNDRVFPSKGKSKAVKTLFDSLVANVILNANVTSIAKCENKYKVVVNNNEMLFDVVVVATGGLSYSGTGSTGDGYKFARDLNHNITNLMPALCGIKCEGVLELQGYQIETNIKILNNNGAEVYSDFGSIIFTSYGVSGPTVFKSSSIAKTNFENGFLKVDFLPKLSISETMKSLDEFIQKNKTARAFDLLNSLVNKKVANTVLEFLKIKNVTPCFKLSANLVRKIAFVLKGFEFKLNGLDDIERATITRGGVDVFEVNNVTMESKLHKNLYFIGEVLDVDALSGGYNLQIAFSTAKACANSILKLM